MNNVVSTSRVNGVNGINAVAKADSPRFDTGTEQRSQSLNGRGVDFGNTASVQKEEKSAFDISKLKEEEKKKLEEELKKMNDSLVSAGKMLKFKYNEEAKQTYVEVIDAESQKVVASLPPEFLIDLSIKMKDLIGMFIDKRL